MAMVYHGTYLENAIQAAQQDRLLSLVEQEVLKLKRDEPEGDEDELRRFAYELWGTRKDSGAVSVSTSPAHAFFENGVTFGCEVDDKTLDDIVFRRNFLKPPKGPHSFSSLTIYMPRELSLGRLKEVYLFDEIVVEQPPQVAVLIQALGKYNPTYYVCSAKDYSAATWSAVRMQEPTASNIVSAAQTALKR